MVYYLYYVLTLTFHVSSYITNKVIKICLHFRDSVFYTRVVKDYGDDTCAVYKRQLAAK